MLPSSGRGRATSVSLARGQTPGNLVGAVGRSAGKERLRAEGMISRSPPGRAGRTTFRLDHETLGADLCECGLYSIAQRVARDGLSEAAWQAVYGADAAGLASENRCARSRARSLRRSDSESLPPVSLIYTFVTLPGGAAQNQ